jgi:AraC-like DNA-binding protein
MELYLVNSIRTPVVFKSDPVSPVSFPSLPGSRVFTFQTNSLFLLVKELATELFTLRYNQFRFSKNQAIESVSRKKGIHSRVMLQNDLHFSVSGIGNIHQAEHSVYMIACDTAQCKALFESGKEYRTLDIYMAPVLAEQLSFFFPELSIDWNSKTASSLLQNPCFVSPSLQDVITEILECPYDVQTSYFYFDLKVREYFYLLLEQHLRINNTRHRFTPYDAQQIRIARDMLLSNLDKQPLTLRELARNAGINEAKLKAGFKHFYDTTVFDCFQHARMEKAKHLLRHTNKPLKDICQSAGYSRMTNFITAFRKYYGYTPASLRRKSL